MRSSIHPSLLITLLLVLGCSSSGGGGERGPGIFGTAGDDQQGQGDASDAGDAGNAGDASDAGAPATENGGETSVEGGAAGQSTVEIGGVTGRGGATDSGGVTGRGGATGSGGSTTGTISEVPLTATDQTTNVTFDNGLTISIPGGVLTENTTLTVQPSPELPATVNSPLELLGSYEFHLGDMTEFAQPITVSIPYDESLLEPQLDEGRGLFVGYWDAEALAWTTVPFAVDTEQNLLSFETRHFSTWVYWTLRGHSSVRTTEGHFDVYYDPSATMPLTEDTTLTMRQFAVLVGELMETAYAGYEAAELRMPTYYLTSTIKVIVTDDLRWAWETWSLDGYNPVYESQAETSPFFSAFTGNILLKLSQLTTENQIRTDGAHELFHVIQNEYATVRKMANNLWWTEGTPDYASFALAWGQTLPLNLFHELTPANYFEEPLTQNQDTHAYQMVRYLDYLVSTQGVDFMTLWDEVSEASNPFTVFETVVTRDGLHASSSAWTNYLAQMCFAPDTDFGALVTNKTLTATDTTLTFSYPTLVGSYSASIARIRTQLAAGQTERTFTLTSSGLGSGGSVELWLARAGGAPTLTDVLVDGDLTSVPITIDATDAISAVAINTDTGTKTVTLTVAETAPTDPGDDCRFPSPGLTYVTVNASTADCTEAREFSLCFDIDDGGNVTKPEESSGGCDSFLDDYTITGRATCSSVSLSYTMTVAAADTYPGCSLSSTVIRTQIFSGEAALSHDAVSDTLSVTSSAGTYQSSYASTDCSNTFPTCSATDLTVTTAR